MSIPTFLIEDQESMKAENKFLSSHSPITWKNPISWICMWPLEHSSTTYCAVSAAGGGIARSTRWTAGVAGSLCTPRTWSRPLQLITSSSCLSILKLHSTEGHNHPEHVCMHAAANFISSLPLLHCSNIGANNSTEAGMSITCLCTMYVLLFLLEVPLCGCCGRWQQ